MKQNREETVAVDQRVCRLACLWTLSEIDADLIRTLKTRDYERSLGTQEEIPSEWPTGEWST